MLILRLKEGRSGLAHGFCYVNPAHGRQAVEEIRRCVRAGMRGIKLWVAVKCNDEGVFGMAEEAIILNLPILQHSYLRWEETLPNESQPAEIVQLAARYSAATIIMAHMAFRWPEGVDTVRDHRNILVDTSGMDPELGSVEYAVEKLGAGRVLFGSDAPGRDILCQIGGVMAADISEGDRRKVMSLLAVASDMGTAFAGTRISGEPAPDGLIPFASVSPDADLRLIPCVKGLRIYPTYHLRDFRGAEGRALLDCAGERKLVVQAFLRLRDSRALLMILDTGEAIKQLLRLTTRYEHVPFVVSGATYAEVSASMALFRCSNVWTDISHLQHPINSLPKLLDLIDSSRVLFGSGAPILYPCANLFRVINSPISDEARERIRWLNAQELIAEAH